MQLNNCSLIKINNKEIIAAKINGHYVYQKTTPPTPPSYHAVEYIKSDGNQYIDTNYKPNDDMVVELDFSTQEYDLGFEVSSRLSNYNNEFTLWGSYSGGVFTRYGTNSGNSIYETPLSLNTRYQLKMGKSLGVQLSTNNFTTYTQILPSFSGTINSASAITLGLFACHDMGEGSRWGGKTKTTLYAFRIYENNVLVREFMPALDTSNIPCVYETIEGIYYYNGGSGTFTYAEL